ncbi:MAG: chemotaxis protein CheX [Campylobacterota bacterium]|nr:chemotaxis protein CheX [Campylobacterota bacterium]
MAIKFFGHYLIDEGKLSSSELIEVAQYQTKYNLSLGELAVKSELITEKEAQKINDKQRTWDKRFGEVAKELNLLSDEQIGILLSQQKKMKVFFGEAVVLKGFMSQNELDQELKNFEEAQKIELENIYLQIDKIDHHNLIKDSIDILQRIYFRTAHDNIKLIDIYKQEDISRDGVISLQKMRGEEHLDFALQAVDKVSLNIASQYLKMNFDVMDEDIADILSEFVNIILGNIAVHLSSHEVVVDLTPPQIIKKENFNYNEYYCFDFSTTKGLLTLCLKI